MRELGMLGISVGALLMAFFDNITTRQVGLGLWLFGAMLIIDALFFRDGFTAQCLWGLWVGGAVALFQYTDVPRTLTDGNGVWVISAATLAVDVVLPLRTRATRTASPE
ncbi:hypothetical protein LHJ74_23015 [Streptomyces sp. N2-109]|uniref:Integral membrane protein n=1 Tax=Streptomyces gossypii TaxID=2883101 RepID=A0ABT2JXW9_9ACTN|nr:hypothetical protein [Streptomyces gossypii]MCT2592747.1 hypothetical protein [Streptomyces gossypii]